MQRVPKTKRVVCIPCPLPRGVDPNDDPNKKILGGITLRSCEHEVFSVGIATVKALLTRCQFVSDHDLTPMPT